MIRDLSESLQALLTQPGLPPELAGAQISFDRPTEPFNPTSTTVDLFLYDVGENTELRSNEPVVRRRDHDAMVERPPLRLDCRYLITAWPVGGADLALQEHRLLGQVLQLLCRFPTIPPGFLHGALVDQQPPLPMVTAQVDGPENPAEFWTAVGNRLRPAVTTTVTISVPVLADAHAPLVTTRRSAFVPAPGPEGEDVVQIGGRVLDPGGSGVAGATVDLLDPRLRTRTDAEGRYQFPRVPAGARTFRVIAVGFQPQAQAITVPATPDAYDVTLTPL
jgi:Pvc16 N-terminal domain/Carboxypeptidase regulatory-like domain